MPDSKNKPPRLDKNGRPYPSRKPDGGKKSAHAKAKSGRARSPKPGAPSAAAYPTDWFFLHRETCPVEHLKELFSAKPELDIEVWPALQVMELTFPNRVYADFEYTADPPQEAPLQALLQREGIRTVYYVSVEPYCSDAELAFLQEAAASAGGLIAADNDTLEPILRGY